MYLHERFRLASTAPQRSKRAYVCKWKAAYTCPFCPQFKPWRPHGGRGALEHAAAPMDENERNEILERRARATEMVLRETQLWQAPPLPPTLPSPRPPHPSESTAP